MVSHIWPFLLTLSSGWTTFPPDTLIRAYRADPHATAITTQVVFPSGGGVHSGNSAATQFPFVEFAFDDETGPRIQFTGMIGAWNRFDLESNWDQIGEDWRFGWGLAARWGEWTVSTHIGHESDHIGDEWVIRTGRTRIAYRRDEWGGAMEYQVVPALRMYGVGAYGLVLGHQNRPWRVQFGGEIEKPEPLVIGARPYFGLDIQRWQESEWSADVGLQAGFAFRKPSTRYAFRLFMSGYRGRWPLGEFFMETTRFYAFGVAVDI